MTADHSPDAGRQRTVAELLRQYGGEAGTSGRRRRRAAEPEPDEAPAAPETAAEQTWSSFATVEREDPEADSAWSDHRSPGLSGYVPRGGSSTGAYRATSHLESYEDEPEPEDQGKAYPATYQAPSASSGVDWFSRDWPPAPRRADGYRGESYQDVAYQDAAYRDEAYLDQAPEERTEQLPRYEAGRPATTAFPSSPPPPADSDGPSTVITSRAELFGDEPDEPRPAPSLFDVPAGLAPDDVNERGEIVESAQPADGPVGTEEPDEPAPSRTAKRGLAAEPAEEPTRDSDDAAPSGLKAWAILIGQGIGGAVGGALLWVGFRFLWLNVPVLALLAAVGATVGLVLVVRAIRGSDELQTTLLAVLVGLIVTISPAVLLLTVR